MKHECHSEPATISRTSCRELSSPSSETFAPRTMPGVQR
ncbi:hypothetical protein RISK_002577 [Rhodopirellula islandica]|uniref:Uncharacterized protein n=1 Tax=Rhodopirellula islandica TaxID=595434 RepID=A0A0J1BFM7_RHOIS|nr:hypothetical protein RISK_002577 [Rhodopirellula islandica]